MNKETLIKSFLPFFKMSSKAQTRTFFKTAKRLQSNKLLRINQRIHKLVCVLTGASPEHDSKEELLNDIDKVVAEISHCRRRFELVTDDDLIDAEIYEELALQSRYAYLMKKARAQGITGRAVLK